jgi:hypothetical protein
MIGFLRNRSLRNLAAREAAAPASVPAAAAAPPVPAAEPELVAAQPAAASSPPAEEPAAAAAPVPAEPGPIQTALSEPEEPPARYQAREHSEGWSVFDLETNDVAAVYGYSLAKMNRARADSLVEVLNRGEARRRARTA